MMEMHYICAENAANRAWLIKDIDIFFIAISDSLWVTCWHFVAHLKYIYCGTRGAQLQPASP